MPAMNTYLQNHLEAPLREYCKYAGVTKGRVMNWALEEFLTKEGFMNDGDKAK